MNLWRDIPVGDKPPQLVNVIVEVIAGSRAKYEYTPEWEVFVLDRVLFSSTVFPVDYGFIPRTWYDDNDPLDAMVLSYEPLEVGCLIKARTIGALVLEDEEGEDPKILTVPVGDPRFDGFKDVHDLDPHRLREIQDFFEFYKRLEPRKWAKVKGWRNANEARRIIDYSIRSYEKKISNTHALGTSSRSARVQRKGRQ